ncbi:TetR/AcrR family transcriptional regulator [Paenibacillus sp. FSL M7-1046]|uniref:TetR/AcrR family transcriptional regulator n=1 Tax=Paenibacillus sp. FSL M7-1046 TaxID=2975315 RepID=UPI0030F9E891
MTKKQLKEHRVESLLMAAVEEFLEKGYDGASVDAIAKRAGVSKGGFYHHFPNKEVLLMEANQKLSEPIMEMAEKAYSNSSVMDGLRQYIKEYLNYWASRPRELSFFFLSMSKALQAPALMEYYREYVNQSTAFLIGMFQKAMESGEADLRDPEAYGISLMGALDGVVSYAMIHPEEDIELLVERFEQVWLK